MVKKEMTAKEFMKQFGRMCRSTSCANCSLVCRNNIHGCGCQTMLRDYPEETLQIVQKWAEEHPEKPKRKRKRCRKTKLIVIFEGDGKNNIYSWEATEDDRV